MGRYAHSLICHGAVDIIIVSIDSFTAAFVLFTITTFARIIVISVTGSLS
jgi:hypothetical protein